MLFMLMPLIERVGTATSGVFAATDVVGVATLIGSVVSLIGAGVALYRARTEVRQNAQSATSQGTETALKAMTELNSRLITENERLSDEVAELRLELAGTRKELGTALTDAIRLNQRVGALEMELARQKGNSNGTDPAAPG